MSGGGGAAAAVAHAKRCTVQLGVYDRQTRTLKNLGSGALLEGGLVITVAHNVIEKPPHEKLPHPLPHPKPLPPLVTHGCTVLVGTFEGDASVTRWSFTAEVLTPLELLREERNGALLDLAVLRLQTAVVCDPPFCEGKHDVLAHPTPTISLVSEGPVADLGSVPFLRCDPAFEPRSGVDRVTVIGYAAAAGSHVHVNTDDVINVSEGYLRTKAFIATGSSGGPVINAAGGIVSVVSHGGGAGVMASTRQVSLLRREHFGGATVPGGGGCADNHRKKMRLLSDRAKEVDQASRLQADEMKLRLQRVEAMISKESARNAAATVELMSALQAQMQNVHATK
eukprot:g4831.t1